jgi:hypothetical protein
VKSAGVPSFVAFFMSHNVNYVNFDPAGENGGGKSCRLSPASLLRLPDFFPAVFTCFIPELFGSVSVDFTSKRSNLMFASTYRTWLLAFGREPWN